MYSHCEKSFFTKEIWIRLIPISPRITYLLEFNVKISSINKYVCVSKCYYLITKKNQISTANCKMLRHIYEWIKYHTTSYQPYFHFKTTLITLLQQHNGQKKISTFPSKVSTQEGATSHHPQSMRKLFLHLKNYQFSKLGYSNFQINM